MMPEAAVGRLPSLVLMWESFGPYHHDRLRALAAAGYEVHAIELASVSRDYAWEREAGSSYTTQIIDTGGGKLSRLSVLNRLLRACFASKARDIFFCHYENGVVLAATLILRLARRRVYTMIDSKFDDYARVLWREVVKSLYLSPYKGALTASRRSREYLHLLGFRRRPVALGYDTIDIRRFAAATIGSSEEHDFAMRPFLVVARLVPKKNISMILNAFAHYRSTVGGGRELHIIGYGPDREELEARARQLRIDDLVHFHGLQPSDAVARHLASSLALILASTEEQFGLVVNEALAAGVPVIVSSAAGAADELIRNLGNGVIVNPHDRDSIVQAMVHCGSDQQRWEEMRRQATASATLGDVQHFCNGVGELIARA